MEEMKRTSRKMKGFLKLINFTKERITAGGLEYNHYVTLGHSSEQLPWHPSKVNIINL